MVASIAAVECIDCKTIGRDFNQWFWSQWKKAHANINYLGRNVCDLWIMLWNCTSILGYIMLLDSKWGMSLSEWIENNKLFNLTTCASSCLSLPCFLLFKILFADQCRQGFLGAFDHLLGLDFNCFAWFVSRHQVIWFLHLLDYLVSWVFSYPYFISSQHLSILVNSKLFLLSLPSKKFRPCIQ